MLASRGQALGTGRGSPTPWTLPWPPGPDHGVLSSTVTQAPHHQRRGPGGTTVLDTSQGQLRQDQGGPRHCPQGAGTDADTRVPSSAGGTARQLVRVGAREQKPLLAAPLIAPWNLDTRARASPWGPSPGAHWFAGLLDCSPWKLVRWEPTHLPAHSTLRPRARSAAWCGLGDGWGKQMPGVQPLPAPLHTVQSRV